MTGTSLYTFPEKIIIAVVSSLVSICCICGNVLVLFAFCVDRSVRTANNYFIISLAVTDLTIGLISLNLLAVYLLLGYWPLGNFICDCWLAVDFTACLVSQVTVFLITLDRFLSVRFPVKYRNWRTDRKLMVMLAMSWSLPAALWIPLVFGWYKLTGEVRPPDRLCNIPFTHYTTFNTILTVTYFWIPLSIMISLYVGIYKAAVGLQRKANASHCGLTELVFMAGTTMSKIGLSVKVAYNDSDAHNGVISRPIGDRCIAQADFIATSLLDGIKLDKSYACGNGLSRQAPSNQSAARLQNEHQTDLVDSGLGDSNNLRRASDFGSTHNRRSSELSLEHPDVSDQYRCIASPNAPSSKSSSMLSECNDPWTRQSPSKIKFTFADSDTKTRYQPIMTKGNETRKTDSSPTTQTTTALVCRRWCLPKKVTKKDSPPTSDTVHSSTDSDKPSPLDTANATFRKSLTTQNGLALLHERLFRFRNQSNVETRKIEQKKEKRARKALRMISFILGAFVVCWTPYHVVIIIKGFCDVPRLGYSCINEHLYNFAYYMCYMNSPINPFCYAMSNITFKRAFLRILKGDFRIR